MKKSIAAFLLVLFTLPCLAETTGTIDYQRVLTNYPKATKAYSELDDQASEMQRYLLDKEKEYKKLESPIQRKAFEEQTAKTLEQKKAALAKIQEKKEQEIDADIDKAIKAVAAENGIDKVVDFRVMYYGGVDITDKVIKKLNIK